MTIKSFLILITSLISLSLFADPNKYPPASLKNPRETFRYFLKTMKGYKLGDKEALPMATLALDLSRFDSATKKISGENAAIKLVNSLDRLEYINYENLPLKVDGKYWVYRKNYIPINNKNIDFEISLTKGEDNKWRFSSATLEKIALFEQYIKNKKVVEGVKELTSWKENLKKKMPTWTGERSFLLLNGQWAALILLILSAFLFEKLMRFLLLSFLINTLVKKRIQIDKALKEKLSFPIALIFFTLTWITGIRFFEFDDHLLRWFLRGGHIIFTSGCVFAAFYLVDYFCLFLEKRALQTESKFDDILLPLIRKSAKTLVVAVGIIAIGDSLTLDMKGLLAGMGIAGLGISLAAKDTLSNLFGSFTVILDRPFRIGDWVKINNTIEGTVETVGLRSCRIRTFHNSLITIPNGLLTNASIDNLGMRRYRRLSTNIGIQYDTPPEKIEAFCEAIRQLILNHPHTRKDNFQVYFNSMGDFSLNILLYVFFDCPDWSVELNERHRLLLDIIRIGKEMNVNFAFPTQTLHINKEQEVQNEQKLEPESIDQYARELSLKVSQSNFTPESKRSSKNDFDI